MKTVNEKLTDAAVKRALELQRIIGGQRKEVKKLFAEIEANASSIIAKHKKLDRIKAPARKKAILQQIITEANKSIYQVISVYSKGFYKELTDIAKYEAEMAAKDINKGVPSNFKVRAKEFKQVADFPQEVWIAGKTAAEFMSGVEYSARTEFLTKMREGFLQGESTDDLIKRVTGWTDDKGIYYKGMLDGVSRRTAETSVRTAIMGVSNEARKRTYDGNADVIKGSEWIATLDMGTCMECANLDGKAWTLDGEPIDGHGLEYQTPPIHLNCVVGDTLVSSIGSISAASKRRVKGEVFIIKTALNNVLTSTPNHPILTSKGWVKACEVDKVGNVISYAVGKGVGFSNRNIDYVPTRIEDKVSSFFSTSSVATMPMPVSAQDFHNDTMNSEVAIIGTYGQLGNTDKTPVSQKVSHRYFVRGNKSSVGDEAGTGGKAFFFKGTLPSFRSFMGILGKQFNLFRRRIVHSSLLLFALVPELNTVNLKMASNSRATKSHSLGDSANSNSFAVKSRSLFKVKSFSVPTVNRLNSILVKKSRNGFEVNPVKNSEVLNGHFLRTIGCKHFGYVDLFSSTLGLGTIDIARFSDGSLVDVTVDNVVSVTKKRFAGHVYNLQTDSGVYIANNIMTHNCRCTLAPVIKSWKEMGMDLPEMDESTRASMDGQVPESKTFDKWFTGLSKERQERYLGNGRYELFKSGKISFGDMVDQNGRELTIDELKKMAK